MRKCKLWLLTIVMILCVGLVAGCSSNKKDNNGSNAQGQGPSMGNNNNQESSHGDTSTNGANNTEDDTDNNNNNNNGSSIGNEGSVTDNTGAGGAMEEVVTEIGRGIQDIGNGLTGDDNANVNDVTSGRYR